MTFEEFFRRFILNSRRWREPLSSSKVYSYRKRFGEEAMWSGSERLLVDNYLELSEPLQRGEPGRQTMVHWGAATLKRQVSEMLAAMIAEQMEVVRVAEKARTYGRETVQPFSEPPIWEVVPDAQRLARMIDDAVDSAFRRGSFVPVQSLLARLGVPGEPAAHLAAVFSAPLAPRFEQALLSRPKGMQRMRAAQAAKERETAVPETSLGGTGAHPASTSAPAPSPPPVPASAPAPAPDAASAPAPSTPPASPGRAWDYDVAFSFAGEDRAYVEAVAEKLRAQGVRVFYDHYETVSLWGRDLYEHLADVYQKRSRYTVIFVSSAYANKVWTTHERKSAQARAFQESRKYILPARFDDTEIPGLLPQIGYIDLVNTPPAELAALIVAKVRLQA